MIHKHYNSSYLEDTSLILKNLKEYSYHPFTEIENGTIIDLGCGTGIDVVNMSKLLNEHVKIIGIDHDPEILNIAKASKKDIPNIDFILSEATPISFADESISGIRSERLMQHLTDPEKVVGEMQRVLKPGHTLLIVETDWLSLAFYNEFVPIEKKIIHYLTEVKINNGLAAKKLTRYMQSCNFKNIKLEVFPFVLKSLKEANDYFWIEKILKEILEKNYLNENEHDLFINALRKADENNYFACSINVVVVSSIK